MSRLPGKYAAFGQGYSGNTNDSHQAVDWAKNNGDGAVYVKVFQMRSEVLVCVGCKRLYGTHTNTCRFREAYP